MLRRIRPNKKAVKCFNAEAHRDNGGEGHILCIVGKDSFYVHCGRQNCKRWTRIQISFPGVDLDFTKSAIVRELMPIGYHFDLSDASTVIGDMTDGSSN